MMSGLFILRIPNLQMVLGIQLGELGVPILGTIVEQVRRISHDHMLIISKSWMTYSLIFHMM